MNPETLRRFEQALRHDVQAYIDELLDQRLGALSATVDNVDTGAAERIAEVRADIAELDKRLNSVLAQLAQAREDDATSPNLSEFRVAEAYRSFVDQVLPAFVRTVHPGQGDPRGARIAVQAQLAVRTSDALFRPRPVTAPELLDALDRPGASELLAVAEDLLGRFTAIRRDCAGWAVWDYQHAGSGPPTERQSLWPGCDDDAAVTVVVTPALSARGRLLVPQVVFTTT